MESMRHSMMYYKSYKLSHNGMASVKMKGL